MDLILSWFFFGTLVGLSASFIELTPRKQPFIATLVVAVFGATIGGMAGFFLTTQLSFFSVPPLFYTLISSFFLVVVPKGRNPQKLNTGNEIPRETRSGVFNQLKI